VWFFLPGHTWDRTRAPIPIPLDYLPLETVDPKEYQDRPYWAYEGKFIAAARLVSENPQLYGLALTNFGCGPNSFMLRMVHDIMGGKPMGQLEIDEHAAEAGIVTRLEAYVDTIVGHAKTGQVVLVDPGSIHRGIGVLSRSDQQLLIPYMSPHAEIIGSAMKGFGINAGVLPEPDSRVLHTRLEAYVDTIVGHAKTGQVVLVDPGSIHRGIGVLSRSDQQLLIPYMSPHAEIIGSAMKGFGINAVVLPQPDSRVLHYADKVTSGVECLPFRVTLGGFLQHYYENGHDQSKVAAFMASAYGPCRLGHYAGEQLRLDLSIVAAFMAWAYGPCRLGHYAGEQLRIFRDLGIDMPMLASVSNNGYRDMQVGSRWDLLMFVQRTWKACVAVDLLQKMVWRSRPYETEPGSADRIFRRCVDEIRQRLENNRPYRDVLRQATSDFRSIIDPSLPRRPLVGINGEIFLRSNDFSNANLVRCCENAGLEVIVSPMAEWMKYVARRNVEDSIRDRSVRRLVVNYTMEKFQEQTERSIEGLCGGFVEEDPPTKHLLHYSRQWLSSKCGSEAVLSIGSGVEWMENPHFAGVISVMPHGCMPGGIVAAMSEKFSATYQKPWINVTFDGIMESANLTRIQNFAEIIRFCRQGGGIQPQDLRSPTPVA